MFQSKVIIKIMGGLGNQMFQYAMVKALSLERNQDFELDLTFMKGYSLHKYGLNCFNIENKISNKPKWLLYVLIKLKILKTYDEYDNGMQYNSNIQKIKATILYLGGYFQSEKYFIKYENEIRNDFKITAPLKEITLQTARKMKEENAVSIHIRRGDYLLNKVHNTDKELFYKNAMKKIEELIGNPVYYVFSDDMNWVKENFSTNCETVYVDFNDAATNYEDLHLMASCKHNIIANSSFSWWGAWLNSNPNKVVIAPKEWFAGDNYDYQDVVPEQWLRF